MGEASAFKIENHLRAAVTIDRGMLHDMASVLTDSANPLVRSLGFAVRSISRPPQLGAFTIQKISETEIALFISETLLRGAGIALKSSNNRAVARLGYEFLRMHDSLTEQSADNIESDDDVVVSTFGDDSND